MKVQIIYTSLTGCTRRLANALYNGIEADEKSIHDIKDGIPTLDGDFILIGYWGTSGHPELQMKGFLNSLRNQKVGIFCTLGYYADSFHAWDTVKCGVDLVKDHNEVIGSYVCNGAVAQNLKDGQGKGTPHIPNEQKEIRWEVMENHPTEKECALAVERFNERIHLYNRCKDLNIPFQSIL